MRTSMTIAALAAAILAADTAGAAPTLADKCEAGKNKVAGAYFACREKAEAAAILKNAMPDFSKCTAKFEQKWNDAEAKGAGDCPDDVLTGDVATYLAMQASDTAAIVAGAAGVPICGDGVINLAGEHCDGANLGGHSCDSLGHTIGSLACTAGCEFDTAGCIPCPGFAYASACWVMSTFGGECDTACADVGLVYDPATATVAGSGGTDAACEDVLTGVGLPGTTLDFPSTDCPDGVGCAFTFMSDRLRCSTPETTSTAAFGGIARACACQ